MLVRYVLYAYRARPMSSTGYVLYSLCNTVLLGVCVEKDIY